MLDLKELCIEPGSLVWTLYADILCINYDGSSFDCACLALMKALQNRILHLIKVKLPDVEMTDSGLIQIVSKPSKKIKISPIASLTLGIHDE